MADGSDRSARWLLAVVVFLIVYGSLFPFNFGGRTTGNVEKPKPEQAEEPDDPVDFPDDSEPNGEPAEAPHEDEAAAEEENPKPAPSEDIDVDGLFD